MTNVFAALLLTFFLLLHGYQANFYAITCPAGNGIAERSASTSVESAAGSSWDRWTSWLGWSAIDIWAPRLASYKQIRTLNTNLRKRLQFKLNPRTAFQLREITFCVFLFMLNSGTTSDARLNDSHSRNFSWIYYFMIFTCSFARFMCTLFVSLIFNLNEMQELSSGSETVYEIRADHENHIENACAFSECLLWKRVSLYRRCESDHQVSHYSKIN